MIGMKLFLYGLAFLLVAGGLLYHFAALAAFNLLVPKDRGVEVVARGVAFGSDPRQRLDIYRPTKSAGAPPVLLFIYGGSWKTGTRSSYEFIGRAFAARGYLTMIADYRLMPEHVFPDFVDDAALAIAFAAREAEKFGGDPERIFAIGHSAGGYNIAQATLDQRYLEKAGCAPCPVKAVALLAAPLSFLPLDDPTTIEAFGKAPNLPATQPGTFARADAPPMLLLHGTGDKTVYPRNSRALAGRLREVGAVVELKEHNGIGHAGIMLAMARGFRGWTPTLEDVLAFFAKHGGREDYSVHR
jgi:acetyl esterase/lipase